MPKGPYYRCKEANLQHISCKRDFFFFLTTYSSEEKWSLGGGLILIPLAFFSLWGLRRHQEKDRHRESALIGKEDIIIKNKQVSIPDKRGKIKIFKRLSDE